MRLEIPRYTERFGAVRIHEVLKVLELDSGHTEEEQTTLAVKRIPEDLLDEIMANMVVVVPVHNERLALLEGVISGIPHRCKVVVVTNSDREPVDRFHLERDTLEQFCYHTQRTAVIAHQKDPQLASILQQIGYTDILDDTGLVRSGKAEGMVLGTLLAQTMGTDYVGFIDSDNFFPGAVWEYIRIYAAGFALSRSPYKMVRILWRYKPKMTSDESIIFKRYGRVSERTNYFLNRLVSLNTDVETDVIKTGNAGEHAMSLNLALLLPFAAGYAVEPQHYVSLFELFGGILPTQNTEALANGIDLFQIESRNPHLHENKGEAHVRDMTLSSLSALYYSAVAMPAFKAEVETMLGQQGLIADGENLPAPRCYPPLTKIASPFQEHFAAIQQQYKVPRDSIWNTL